MSDVPQDPPPLEPPFPDEAFVVRGGLVEAWSLENNATNHKLEVERETGQIQWAISVGCRADASVRDLAMEAGQEIPTFDQRQKMRVSTVGALRAKGYDVIPDGLPHALILLPDSPAGTDYVAVESTFGPLIANPSYKGAK